MCKQAASINKIIEIDMDTDRETQVIIRQVSSVGYDRERQPDSEVDIKDHIIILVNALGGAILKAESDGTRKPGEAMKRAIELLHDIYVDASASVTERINDAKGNKINGA
jgi:hypothetical protein